MVPEELDNVPEGLRITIHTDEDAPSPRGRTDDRVHVLMVPDLDEDPGPWGQHWEQLLADHGPAEAVARMKQWASVHGVVYEHRPPDGSWSLWYLTTADAADFTDPVAALKSYADEYEAWANGEVYGYVIEREVRWQRQDDPSVTRTTWEVVDSCWGFYESPDYVADEARAACAALR